MSSRRVARRARAVVKEFDAVVFNGTPGSVYGPVRSDFGHHLIYVHSVRLPSER